MCRCLDVGWCAQYVEDTHTTSFVEESFYVVQQSSSRALATGSTTCVCGVINTVVASLEGVVCAELTARLERAAAGCGSAPVVTPAGGGGSTGTGGGDADGGVGHGGRLRLSPEFLQLAVAVNNVEVRGTRGGGRWRRACAQLHSGVGLL